MSTEKLVKKVITWVSVIMAIGLLIFACRSCVKAYDSKPFVGHIMIREEKSLGGIGTINDIADIEIDPEYRVRDYVVDYENKQIIINLEVKKQ